MKIFVFFLSVTCLALSPWTCRGQVTNHETTFLFQTEKDTVSITLGGLLDAENTFTYPSTRAFQPMKKLSLTNVGDKILRNPRIIFNNQGNWFDIASLRNEIFSEAVGEKDQALSLWKFMRDNRVHRFEPECCDEINDPIKLLGVYGYGMCYNSNYANAFVASGLPQSGQPYQSYSPNNGIHFVSNVKFGTEFKLMDVDLETFYLGYDNHSIENYDNIASDKYLVSRIHHGGKNESYNLYNEFIGVAVYQPQPNWYFGLYNNFHTLDFDLRPGETLEYSWAPGTRYHSYGQTHNAQPDDIGNGKFIYKTNFRNVPLNSLVGSISNVSSFFIDSLSKNLHPASVDSLSSFVVQVKSPFVIVGGHLKGWFSRNSSAEELSLSFSKDSVNWQTLWTSSELGTHTDSISLDASVATLTSAALYSYFLKFQLKSETSIESCGIDSLVIVSDFQVSRSFLPAIRLGVNQITYADNGNIVRNAELKLQWQETNQNTPPQAIVNPIFPKDNAQVNGLRFTFFWEPSTDPDIVDYEFILSDRSDFKFPLSPSFEVYTSKSNNGPSLANFTIEYDGMLNPGTTYYWKVRAKDAEGAWSDWSPRWSFTPNGPAIPQSPTYEIKADTLTISWQQSSEGSKADFYELHASNLRLGFIPGDSTLLATLHATSIHIPLTSDVKTFYRLIAVDALGNKSGPSKALQLPYPYVYPPPDSIQINRPFTLSLKTNQIYTLASLSRAYVKGLQTYRIPNNVSVTVLKKPDWLTFNSTQGTLTGTPNYLQAITFDSVTVRFTADNGYVQMQTFKPAVARNHSPILAVSDTVAYAGGEFMATVRSDDSDLEFGDKLYPIEVVRKPSWIEFVSGPDGSLTLSGTPTKYQVGDHFITLSVRDASTSVTATFRIRVLSSPEIIKTMEACSGQKTNVTLDLNGTGPWTIRYVELQDTIHIDSITSSPYTLSLLPTKRTWYTIEALSIDGVPTHIKIEAIISEPIVKGLTERRGMVGSEFASIIVIGSGCPSEFSIKLLAYPEWLHLGPNGELKGLPEDKDVGLHTVSFSLTDEYGNSFNRSADITIDALPSDKPLAKIYGDNNICRGQSTLLTVSFTGNMPWNFRYTDGVNMFSIEDIQQPIYELNVSPIKTTEYTIDAVNSTSSPTPALVQKSSAKVVVDSVAIRPVPNQIAYEGAILRFSVEAYYGQNENLHFGLSESNTWLTIDPLTGQLSGRPEAGDVGDHVFELLVTDPCNNIYKKEFTVKVIGVQHLIQADILQENAICASEKVRLAISYQGNKPWGFSYANGSDTVTVSNITSNTFLESATANKPEFTLVSLVDPVTGHHRLKLPIGTVLFETPSVTGLTKFNGMEKSEFDSQILASSECDSDLQFELVNGPSWMSVDKGTGRVTGLPNEGDAGSVSVAVRIIQNGVITVKKFEIIIHSTDYATEFPRVMGWPNPFTDHFTITVDVLEATNIEILIIDPLGRIDLRTNKQVSSEGEYDFLWEPQTNASGLFLVNIIANGKKLKSQHILRISQ